MENVTLEKCLFAPSHSAAFISMASNEFYRRAAAFVLEFIISILLGMPTLGLQCCRCTQDRLLMAP